jgi:signal peptidase I
MRVRTWRRRIEAILLVIFLVMATLPILATQSGSPLSPSGAELTGMLYDDQGVDSDGNGYFDCLRLDVQVNVSEAGIYRVYVSGLYSSNGSYISVSNEKSMLLETGLQVINVSLAGPVIYASRVNPANVSYISLYDYSSGALLGSVQNIPLPREYTYEEFDRPGASLTGVVSDEGEDTDGDILLDYLIIHVQINVTEPGMYGVNIQGLLNASFYWIYVYGYKTEYLDVGLQNLNVTLDGVTIYNSGLNPRYVSNINLQDGSYGYTIESLSQMPLSREYLYTDFDPPAPVPPSGARLTGIIEDKGVDLDGDDLFDYLEIGVQVNVTMPSIYRVEAYGLRDGNWSYIDVWSSASSYFNAGIHSLNISFLGSIIHAYGINPQYLSHASLYDQNNTYLGSLDSVSLSRQYSYTEFEIPDAVLTGVIFDQGVDTDGDGAFNYLQVNVEVNVTNAKVYRLGVDGLRDVEMNYIPVSSYFSGYLTEGTHEVSFALTGSTIYSNGMNPKFVNAIYLQDENYNFVDKTRQNVPLSREYSYTEFEPPIAELTGRIVDTGVDDDGNGLFDYLLVGVEVNVTEAGTYIVSVSNLLDSELNYIDIYGSNTMYLALGLQTVNVPLLGPKIYSSTLNPRLVSWINLQDQNWTTLESKSNVPLSREYFYQQFDPPGARLTGKISDRGLDTDGDGFFNYLEIEVEVNVTENGSYNVWASDLLDSGFNYISVYSSSSNYLAVGIRTVNLTLNGLSIRMSGRDPFYVSGIYLQDERIGDIGRLERVPLSGTYSHLQFEPPKAILTGTIYDRGVDTDSDGRFDYLEIGVEINVSDYGYYRVEVSGLKDSAQNNTVSISNSVSGYFDVGVQVLNVSLHGPSIFASHINPRYISSIYLYNDLWLSQYDIPLSREYLYAEFDLPSAFLTGGVFDNGADTDGDGKFNYLQIGVEVNVSEAGYYQLYVFGILDSNGARLDYGYSAWTYLEKGLQVVYFSIDGLRIRLSQFNPKYVDYISLYDQDYRYIGGVNNILLSREYSYAEFETPGASFTGVITDEGEDTDGDGKFNYLNLGMQLDVTEAGYYRVEVQLRDSHNNYTSLYASAEAYLNVGVSWLNVSFNGLEIYINEFNPSYLGSLSLRDWNYQLESLYNVQISREYSYDEFDPPGAVLTGVVFDQGVDTDPDGTYDYLRIGVEVNVTDAGYFRVYVERLCDTHFNYIDVYNQNYTYLTSGLHIVYVDLAGPPIFLSRLNPRYVAYISLWIEESGYQDYLNTVPLSKEYSYMDFDPPTALLTGKIYDRGVDTDGDGSFNYLEISVEINVTKPGNFYIQISELRDSNGNWIGVWGSKSGYLDAGLGVLNVSLDGSTIYAQERNPRYVSYIDLSADYSSSINDISLSREYLYTEFDFPAVLTGVIWDQGVDMDSDGLFDYLEVRVQINVSDAGKYSINIYGLHDSSYNYISVYDYKTIDLNAGIQTVSLYLYGPQIYTSRKNPTTVSSVTLQPYMDPLTPYPYPYYSFYDYRNELPLSRQYLYTEFEAPFLDVETKFTVYPDGRVAVSGAVDYTNVVPENTPRYTTAQGYFNLTGDKQSSQALAKFSANLPEIASNMFPFNSTSAALRAQYSNGVLNLGVNSSGALPPFFASQFPFNSTEGSVSATYSGGILNINVEGGTTLPPLASQQFPFNVTDLHAVGSYSPHTLDGTITFSVLPDFTFDDVNVDFSGCPTDLVLNGTVHVVFGAPFGNLIIHDENELIQAIDELKTELLGENGIIWNFTGGRLNATSLDIDYVLEVSGIGAGARVSFRLTVHGDFVQALAYLLSGGKNEALLSPVLDEAYQSILNGSFDVKYFHTTQDASVKLSFSYDFKRLMDYVLTPPQGITPFVVTSYSMSPTLWQGDVVLVEEVASASEIVAIPESGDIIAFYNPSDQRYIVTHRAIAKTYSNGTWYFSTKGDINAMPDYWVGAGTLDGAVSENLLVGKVVQRIPLLGNVISYPYFYYPYYYYPYAQTTTAARLSLSRTAFDSVEKMSVYLSYSSLEKRFNFNLTQVDKLKTLIDAGFFILPEILPIDTPSEVRTFVESLLNTTYATMDTADISFTYGNGKVDFDATASINGDLSQEANYIKDLYFQLLGAQYSHYRMQVPWQMDFINQTTIDMDKFKISAKLGETTFEGKLEGLVLTPPREVLNATDFKLERLFNLTAPQYSWQQEFPEEDQQLQITIEGGSNSTHMVTLFRPSIVPEPDLTGPYRKSMIWFNQTLSSLKDLVFEIQPIEGPATGTLSISTTPVSGDVSVNGTSWGIAPQSKAIQIGTYNVSFGGVDLYYTPTWQLVSIYENQETNAVGVYTPITGTLTITTVPVAGEVFVNGTSWGFAPQTKLVNVGAYNISFASVSGYYTPSWQLATISENVEKTVNGVYEPIIGTLEITITNIRSGSEETATLQLIDEDHDGFITLDIENRILAAILRTHGTTTFDFPGEYSATKGAWSVTLSSQNDYTVTCTRARNAISRESVIDHFSLWVIMGQAPASTTPPWLLITGVALIIAAVTVVAIYIRKRKP